MQTRMPSRWKIFIAVGLLLIVADQWTKYLAVRHLTPGVALASTETPPAHPSAAEIEALEAEVGTFEGLGYFYGSVKHPCRPAGFNCPTVKVVDGFWSHRYVENPGAAWGVLRDASESVRVPFFLVLSLGAVVFILAFFRKLTDDQHLMIWSLSLVFGGAVGNLIDRLHLSYVVDFIDWYVGSHHWPTFNVADAGITVGVGLLMVEWLRDAIRSKKEAAANPGTETAEAPSAKSPS